MKSATILTMLACAAAALATPAVAQQGPSVLSPSTPRTSDLPLPLPMPPDPASDPPREEKKSGGDGSPPKITLQDKDESINPSWDGAGVAEGGTIAVKAGGNKLTATLAASSYAHCSFSIHAAGVNALRLVQAFDITPSDPKDPQVALTLAAKLDGFVRSESNGVACLRLADVAVIPVCGGPALCLAFPPCCTNGCGAQRCERTVELPTWVVPAGRYVLVANLVPEATVDGIFHGHAEAVFSPAAGISWNTGPNPFADLDRKDFGLAVTLKVAAP